MKTFFRIPTVFLATLSLLATPLCADPIPVKHTVGALHGFLTIRSSTGAILGHGDYYEFAQGERVTARLTMHFRDGSLDDETTVFTQRQVFAFLSDHHIQRGPFFKNAIDAVVESNGNVTVRTTGKDGKEKVETNHIDLPPDLSNGMVGVLLLNVAPNAPAFSLGMVLPTGRGRLIKLDIEPAGTHPFSASPGDRRTANLFRIKLNLGGVAGVVAPIIGKQPADIMVWVYEGEVPVMLREVGQLAEDGPIVSIELSGATFK
jgi:hypothetical protein